MIPRECKRLAEVDFPIAAVSRHAAREKSIRHGHPSTLHLWWARRRGYADEEPAATYDVFLNDVAFWSNVPARVWTYTIGGYQVIKKWLSYREHELLGRALTTEEAREVTNMARRVAAILLLEPSLDANYRAVREDAYAWPGKQ